MEIGAKLRRGIEWVIAALVVINVLLVLLFLEVLFGGAITDGIEKYVKDRYLYAPPVVALLVSSLVSLWPLLWKGTKWLLAPHLPGPAKQKRLFHSMLGATHNLIQRWKLATAFMIVVLALLTWTQIWAVDGVCSPNPMNGPYDGEEMALSDDERFLYLTDDKNGEVAIFAALPETPDRIGIGAAYRPVGVIRVKSTSHQGNAHLQDIALSPDGRYLYVVSAFASANGTVSMIDLQTRRAVRTVDVGENPRWIVRFP